MTLAPPPLAEGRVDMSYFKPDPAFDDDVPFPETEDYSNGQPEYRKSITFRRFADVLLTTGARYIVKGIVPAVGLAVVWGPPKCGKSFFVFDLVAHVAAGWEYRGRRTKQCPVVYFALEGQQGFEARIAAFKQAHSVGDIPFYLSADRIQLPHDGAAIIAAIRSQLANVIPGVVVLDTLNRSIEGSENESADMGNYVRAADTIREAFGCAVIVIHHCGIEGSRPRGHTSLSGACDAQIAVKRDGLGNVLAVVEFMKDGPEGDEVASRLEHVVVGTDEDGEGVTSCVVRPADMAVKSRPKVTGQPGLALGILQDTIIEKGEVIQSSEIPGHTRTCLEIDWRDACYSRMFENDDSQDTKRKAFVRSAKVLQERKVVAKYGDRVWIV